MRIERKEYLDRLVRRMWNGSIKVVTGVRRCGKSYLIFNLFRDYLARSGVDDRHVIAVELDRLENESLREKHAFQVVLESEYVNRSCFDYTSPVVVPAKTFLSQLV